MDQKPRILYCHCNYAKVVPDEVKTAVLRRLCDSKMPFEAVADLCEMSARRDPALGPLAQGPVKIAACFPRAVKWLFAAAGSPLPAANAEVLNMREFDADRIMEGLARQSLEPNVPEGGPSGAAPAPENHLDHPNHAASVSVSSP